MYLELDYKLDRLKMFSEVYNNTVGNICKKSNLI